MTAPAMTVAATVPVAMRTLDRLVDRAATRSQGSSC